MIAGDARGLVVGERLALTLVGHRPYVRALDILALCETRFPDFRRCELTFRRPLQPNLEVEASRSAHTAATVTLLLDAASPLTVFLANRGVEPHRRVPEPAVCWHWLVRRAPNDQSYLSAGGAADYRKLEAVFARFQSTTGQRYAVRTLRLTRARRAPVEVLRVRRRLEGGSPITRFRLTRNGSPWCEIEAVPAGDVPFSD
ncbi:MAG: hypothetical protein U1E56_05410 [Bauldia sp.]